MSGQPQAALISGLLTVGVTITAIAYRFVSNVTNRVLDKMEEEREQVSQWVNQQMTLYRKTPFILTSRPHGYRSNPVSWDLGI